MVNTGGDERFEKFKTSSKFKPVQRNKKSKVKIDKRFKSMLQKESEFDLNWKRDRYGREVIQNPEENLNRFYRIREEKAKKSAILDPKKDDKEIDRARGIGISSSESEPDSETDDEAENEAKEDQDIYDKDNPRRSEDIFRRIAVTNMDWDRVNATDIYVLLLSVVPSGGSLKCVTVYISEFGKTRIKDEERHGPKMDREIEDEDERLRVYQLDRLKYYYAVCETDSPETADEIYKEFDGQDYGDSGVNVDLRFIPDEIDFDQDQIRVQRTTEKKDICNEKPINYTPPDFVSSALTRTKCDLTWDETDRRRRNLLRKSDLVEDQVQHLIASGSETDEDDPEALEKREETKRKFQLLLNNEEEDDFFKSNEGNEDTRSDSDEENPVKTEDDGNKEFKMEMKNEVDDSSDALISDDESVNKKSKKRRKIEDEVEETEEVKKERAELELVMMSSSDDEGRKHFDLREEERERRKNKKKRKFKNQKSELSEGINLEDNRFSSKLLSHPDFGLDSTHPSFKVTKSTEEIRKRRVVKKPNQSNDEKSGGKSEGGKKKKLDETNDIVARLKLRHKK